MKLLNCCVLCGGSSPAPYAMRFKVGTPHIARVRCTSCTAVFANPIAEESELVGFYQNYYDKGNFELFRYKETHSQRFRDYEFMTQSQLRGAFDYVLKYKESGAFLDIGFGLGDPLYLAQLHGFKVFGTEYDADAIAFVSSYVPDGTWHQGDLMDSPFEEGSFHFIRFWHVLEHVLAPREYMRKIRKLLKPTGVLIIGTPNISNAGYRLHRFANLSVHRIPGIVDGMEHTVLFNRRTLSKLVEAEGLEIIEHYTHSHVEDYRKLLREQIPQLKKVVRVLQSVFHINQTLYAKRPD